MRLLISTSGSDKELPASSESILSALHPQDEVWYGDSVSLDAPDGLALMAICVSGGRLLPDEAGEFLLILSGGGGHKESLQRFTRQEAAEYLVRFLDGNRGWIGGLAWHEA